MTDAPQWQPPSDLGASSTPPAGPLGVPGWTPPPKPGLIPLRPLPLGTILGASFQVLRRNPRAMFGFALLLTAVTFVLTLLSVGLVAVFVMGRLSAATAEEYDTVAAGAYAAIGLAALVPALFSIVVTAVLQGVVALEVARGTVGEKLRIGGLWRAARGRIGALIGWTLLITAALVVTLVIVVLLITSIVVLGGTAGIIAGILIGILAFFGALALGFWLSTRLALVPSVLMLERLPLGAAIARSWSLTTGFFWRTLGIQLLVWVIVQIVSSIITTPLSMIFSMTSAITNPNGDVATMTGTLIVLSIVSAAVSLIFGAIAAVVQSATTALLYIDIRMRKEGLDLELSRFVEARQAGQPVPDPYLQRPPTA